MVMTIFTAHNMSVTVCHYMHNLTKQGCGEGESERAWKKHLTSTKVATIGNRELHKSLDSE